MALEPEAPSAEEEPNAELADMSRRFWISLALTVPLIGLAISSPLLVGAGPFYRLAAAGQALFYGLAAAGIALRGRPISKARPLAFPAFFCLVNLAALHAAINVVRGHRIDRWEPQRPTDRPSGEPGEPVDPARPGKSGEPSEPVPDPDAATERVA